MRPQQCALAEIDVIADVDLLSTHVTFLRAAVGMPGHRRSRVAPVEYGLLRSRSPSTGCPTTAAAFLVTAGAGARGVRLRVRLTWAPHVGASRVLIASAACSGARPEPSAQADPALR